MLALTRDRGRRPCIHQGQLRVRIGTAIRGAAAATNVPRVAFEALVSVQSCFAQKLALVLCRPPGDGLDGPAVSRCFTNVIEALLEAGQLFGLAHGGILPGFETQVWLDGHCESRREAS